MTRIHTESGSATLDLHHNFSPNPLFDKKASTKDQLNTSKMKKVTACHISKPTIKYKMYNIYYIYLTIYLISPKEFDQIPNLNMELTF